MKIIASLTFSSGWRGNNAFTKEELLKYTNDSIEKIKTNLSAINIDDSLDVLIQNPYYIFWEKRWNDEEHHQYRLKIYINRYKRDRKIVKNNIYKAINSIHTAHYN